MDDQTETFGPGSPARPRLPSPRVRRPNTPSAVGPPGAMRPAPRDRIWVFLSEEKRKNFLNAITGSVVAFLFDRHEPRFHRSRPPFDRF